MGCRRRRGGRHPAGGHRRRRDGPRCACAAHRDVGRHSGHLVLPGLRPSHGFFGGLVLMRYGADWNCLGAGTLRAQAHWSEGLVIDGQRFFLACLGTSPGGSPTRPPVHLNVRLRIVFMLAGGARISEGRALEWLCVAGARRPLRDRSGPRKRCGGHRVPRSRPDH